jgi:hypothetical protein
VGLEKVISGGQTGVDQAALHAAEQLGIETGGWAPKGWRTLDGPRPTLGSRWGLKEFPRGGYKERTWQNVEDSDCTLQIAMNFGSPGERCTANAIRVLAQKSVRVHLGDEVDVEAIAQQIRYFNPRVLNVAGNAEQTVPGIFKLSKTLLLLVFELVIHPPNRGSR